jgi:hypothetical protein
MKRWTFVLILLVLAAVQSAPAARQAQDEDARALRARLEERFDVVPLADGVALRPKSRIKDVRLIEISDGAVLVNGAVVTGGELRERLGPDADALLRLSYMSAADRQAFIAPPAAPVAPDLPLEAPAAPAAPTPPADPERPAAPERGHRTSGDRVRIFGDVSVGADESVSGQVVAVMGSVRIDGEVNDQVVAVLGSVTLGPKAYVRGDVVAVGGRVRKAEGARIGGAVTEVSALDPNINLNFVPLFDWGGVPFFGGSGPVQLIGSTLRFFLLVMLASIAMVIARPSIEASARRVAERPIQTAIIGILAEILLVPAIVITVVILAVSIIGIPLLLLVPFALLLIVAMALVGFSGTAYAVGQATRRRLSMAEAPPFVDIFLGVMVVLMPVLVARLIGLVGWPGTPLVVLLLMLGVAVEFFAWSSGFGAVIGTSFSRWQARRR